jgi:hypothetical protein
MISDTANPRAPLLWLCSDRQHENQHKTLLIDIRTVFDRYNKDRLRTKAELIPALAGLEDSIWSEWTGLDGTAAPHMLTQGDIGRLLRPFGIKSKALWPPRRGRRDQQRERVLPCAVRGGMGLLLRTERHTATPQQNQALNGIESRHTGATSSTMRVGDPSPHRPNPTRFRMIAALAKHVSKVTERWIGKDNCARTLSVRRP